MQYTQIKKFFQLINRNLLFYISRKIDYPLVAPDAVQINFTFRCNLRCKMCSMYEKMQLLKREGNPYELDNPTMKKIIKEASEMGVRSLILVGGEPFLEPRIFELISFANECNIRGVTVVTNGTLLSEGIIEQIFDNNLSNLSISIDAASEEAHRKIRGENLLKKIIDNIGLINMLKEKQNRAFPRITCVCTVMDQNLEELLDVVNLCKRLKISQVIFQPVVSDNTDQTKVDFKSSVSVPEWRYTILDKAINELIKYKTSSLENFDYISNSLKQLALIKKYFRAKLRPRELPCYAGYNRIQVVQEGKVYFCVNQDKYESTFGDIRKDNLQELWFSGKARSYRRLIKKCVFPCIQWCAYRDDFNSLIGIWQKELINKHEIVQRI